MIVCVTPASVCYAVEIECFWGIHFVIQHNDFITLATVFPPFLIA